MIDYTCEYCGRQATARYPSWVRRYCSQSCAHTAIAQRPEVRERMAVWRQANLTRPDRGGNSATHRRCKKCGIVKPLEAFGLESESKYGRSYRCFVCVAADTKARYGPRVRERVSLSRKVHRVKVNARARVATAIRRGRMQKPTACSVCGRTGTRIAAHHEDYSKPLDVQWLCSRCHGATRVLEAR